MALSVWQPEVVRGRHRELVEQSVVPVEYRVHALEMELRVCKQQILGLEKTYVRQVQLGLFIILFYFIFGWGKKLYRMFNLLKECL